MCTEVIYHVTVKQVLYCKRGACESIKKKYWRKYVELKEKN